MITLTTTHRRRLILIIAMIVILALVLALVLYALRSNINFFYTPSTVISEQAPFNHEIRVGGVVEENSVHRLPHQIAVEFVITDFVNNLNVYYDGILPDLFREGQSVVVLGKLQSLHQLVAQQVLAKHDENYTPPEVKQAFAKNGIASWIYHFNSNNLIKPMALLAALRLQQAINKAISYR